MEKVFRVEGMSCQHCVKAVEIELSELDIDSFEVEIGKVTVNYNDTKVNIEEIEKSITDAGFKVL